VNKETNVKRCVKVLRKSVMGQKELQKLTSELKILQKLVSFLAHQSIIVRITRTLFNYMSTLRMIVAST
jgi:hypothetical protein